MNHHEYSLEESSEDEEEEEIKRLSRNYDTIQSLQAQIPTLLSTPLTEESAKTLFDENVQLVVEDIVLASTRTEIVSLSTTLVLATLATNQANTLLLLAATTSRFGRPSSSSSNNNNNNTTQRQQQQASSSSRLESKMAINASLEVVRVEWNVTLPAGAGQTSPRQSLLQGVTELQLDPITYKVSTLRLLQVKWNQEQRLNARAIGESLASLRTLVKAFQDSPVVKNIFIPGGVPSLSSLLGSDILQQLSPGLRESKMVDTEPAPLFVTEELENAFVSPFSGNLNVSRSKGSTNATRAATLIPISEYNGNASDTSVPFPGSKRWNKFITSRRVYQIFVNETLPVLAGNEIVPSRGMLELFSTSKSTKLVAVDGSVLLTGRDQVGNFFHTVASWRKRSSGTWELTNATLLEWWGETITIAVGYHSTTKVPGSASPVVIDGVDHFVLQVSGVNDNDEIIEILILQVEQKQLNIGGVRNSPDGLWFMTSLVNALDTGHFSSVGGDSVVMDLLQRVISGDIVTGPAAVTAASVKRKRRIPPKLSESVAARVYNIMLALYDEVPLLLDKERTNLYVEAPLKKFLSDDIELRGYLGETLARGTSAYNRVIGASFASLKAAQATGSVKMEQEPSLSVELAAEGNVRTSLTIMLKVLPLPSGTSNLIKSISGSTFDLPSSGFPLDISVVSDYAVDRESGDIYQHRLIESRVNGQLTPGDVLSKWIQQQSSPTGGGTAGNEIKGAAAFRKSLMETIAWVMSQNRG